jgi:hypothetical protein
MKFPNQAQFLRETKDKFEFSNLDLSKILGVSQAYVSNMVKGKAGIPPERVHKLLPFVPFHLIGSAASRDFQKSWIETAQKGLRETKASGKAPRHEKTKAKKQKRKT